MVGPRARADHGVREERRTRKVVAMRRLLVLALAPWVLLTIVGVSRASAATNYPGPTPPSTAVVLGTTETTPAPHGTSSGSSLPFTGGDVAMLLGFAAAVLVPGTALLVVSRRRSRAGLHQA